MRTPLQILIVDDNPANLDIFETRLAAHGAKIQHPLTSAFGSVSRVSPVQTAVRNCTRDEGRPFGFGDRELIPSYRKLLRSRAMVVSVAEKSGR